jgi:HEAT repeat protein
MTRLLPESTGMAASLTGLLVSRPQYPRAGKRVWSKIVSLGEVAIPSLEALLRDPSQEQYRQRVLAANALAAIGGREAIAALLRALRDSSTRAVEPGSMEAKCIVICTIAEHLARTPNAEIIDALRTVLRALARRKKGTIHKPRGRA